MGRHKRVNSLDIRPYEPLKSLHRNLRPVPRRRRSYAKHFADICCGRPLRSPRTRMVGCGLNLRFLKQRELFLEAQSRLLATRVSPQRAEVLAPQFCSQNVSRKSPTVGPAQAVYVQASHHSAAASQEHVPAGPRPSPVRVECRRGAPLEIHRSRAGSAAGREFPRP